MPQLQSHRDLNTFPLKMTPKSATEFLNMLRCIFGKHSHVFFRGIRVLRPDEFHFKTMSVQEQSEVKHQKM